MMIVMAHDDRQELMIMGDQSSKFKHRWIIWKLARIMEVAEREESAVITQQDSNS